MQKMSGTIHKKQSRPEKVIQFGTGNFLRAFTDWMIHRMNETTDFNGSVVIVQSTKCGAAGAINAQDGLYTLFSQGMIDGEPVRHHEVIESISRAINVHEQETEYWALAKNPDVQFVVSNTTEAGILFDDSDTLDEWPQTSFPGKLTALLYERFQHFQGDKSKGLVMLPCELIDQNGAELKKTVLQYADKWALGAAFCDWIEKANVFCNSLVDRIVPGYPKTEQTELEQLLGYKDELMVAAEHYHLWAIEGPDWLQAAFPATKAGLNVQIVSDLTPFRLKKVSLLNGAHTALTPVALLAGIETVGAVMNNPLTRVFVEELMMDEVIPALDLPRADLETFARDVLIRFENPYVEHYVTSIALNAIPKWKARNMPVLIQYMEKTGRVPVRMALSLAAWIHVYKEEAKDAPQIVSFFHDQWARQDGTDSARREMVKQILGNEELWGVSLVKWPELTETVADFVNGIEQDGMKKMLRKAGAEREKNTYSS